MIIEHRHLSFALVCLAIAAVVGPNFARGGDPAPAAKQGMHAIDARVLSRDLVRSVAFTVKSARAATGGKLDPKLPHAKPFWTELRRMEKAASAIAAGLKIHDARVFPAIAEGAETLAALKVAWHRTGVADKGVKEGIATLSHAYGTMRKHYGKEAIRRKQGGALTEKEQKSLAELKEKEAKLAAHWKALRDQAKAKGQKRVAAELDHLIGEAERIAKADATVDAYILVLTQIDTIEGEWAAYAYYVPADLHEAWVETATFTETTFTSFDATYAAEVDSVVVDDWSYLDTDIEVSSDVDYDVEITDEEVAAEDSYLEDDVHDTSAEEYDTETADEPDAEDADDHEEFDDTSGGDDGGGDDGD